MIIHYYYKKTLVSFPEVSVTSVAKLRFSRVKYKKKESWAKLAAILKVEAVVKAHALINKGEFGYF